MRANVKSRLKAAYDLFGEQMSRQDILNAEEEGKLPRGTITSVINYSETVERGVYSLSKVLHEILSDVDENESAPADAADEVQRTVVLENTKVHVVKASVEKTIPVPNKDPFFVKSGCYEIVEKVVSSGTFCPVYISGPSGNGKTMSVEQACANTSRPLVIFNVTNETTEEDLIGHYYLNNGDLVWRDGPVLTAYKEGAILCLDEVDQGTSRLMCLQTILQNKPYYVKKTGETVSPAEGFNVFATANTMGKGDDTDQFIGAQIMNEAFLERFPVTVEQEYPNELTERRIVGQIIKKDKDLVQRLVKWAHQTRKAFDSGHGEAQITTRRLVQIANLIGIFDDAETAIKHATARFGKESADALMKLYRVTV